MSDLQVTAVRLEGGEDHASITRIYGPAFGEKTVEEVVSEIENLKNRFRVGFGQHSRQVLVHVERPPKRANAGRPFLRTRANGVPTDHLLSLPRF